MPITFTKVSLPHGWLGNMSPYPIRYRGQEWRTAEALFQALRFASPAIREEIRSQKSPMTAKMVAKQHGEKAMAFVPRSAPDLRLMRFVLTLKIKQHPDLRQRLVETAPLEIIEDVTNRADRPGACFWGKAWKPEIKTWVGENALGELWMDLRTDLRVGKEWPDSWCPRDTNGDGNCGSILCPWCGDLP